MRVVYVEDNLANLALVRRVARMGQHEVVAFNKGREALDALLADPPDLVLIDIQLSGDMDGLDLTRALRQAGMTVPIIAVTAYAMVGDRERCLDAGCTDYLPKPLPISELIAVFERYSTSTQSEE